MCEMWIKAPLLKRRDSVAVLKSEIDILVSWVTTTERNLSYTVMVVG